MELAVLKFPESASQIVEGQFGDPSRPLGNRLRWGHCRALQVLECSQPSPPGQ